MEALIDGDVAVYRVGFTTEEETNDGIVLSRVRDLLTNILYTTQASSHRIFLTSGEKNFRLGINPEYKANRKGKPKPVHYNLLRDYLTNEWKAEVRDYDEADDAMGIWQTRLGDNSIICTNDKDMYQVPGHHYNWTKDSFTYVEEPDAIRFFYQQILTGDTVDNVIGLHGIGPVKASKYLGSATTDKEYWDAVCAAYAKHDRPIADAIMNAKCVWIRRCENQIWEPPTDT